MNRRWHFLTAAVAATAGDGTDLYPLYLLLKMLSKYTTFSALVSIRLLIIEIFPTPVRGSLVGLTAMFGLLGSGLGYYYSVMVSGRLQATGPGHSAGPRGEGKCRGPVRRDASLVKILESKVWRKLKDVSFGRKSL